MPKSVNYNNPKDFIVNQRIRAWLDIKCAHCHGKGRPAEKSIIEFRINSTDPGIMMP